MRIIYCMSWRKERTNKQKDYITCTLFVSKKELCKNIEPQISQNLRTISKNNNV